MNYRGREVNVLALWGQWCDGLREEEGEFLSLAHCPNPDHDNTRSPAFQINQWRPLVHCFSGCGISGTYEHAICVIEGLYDKYPDTNQGRRRAQREARKFILRHARIGNKKPGEFQRRTRRNRHSDNHVVSEAAHAFELELRRFSYLPPVATEYLAGRGISGSTASRFEIGYDADERRIVIPVRDSRERIRGLIRRAIRPQDHPKYLYTDGFDRNTLLFGIRQIDPGLVKSKGLVLVEGSLDVICLHDAGIGYVLGILGSKISRQQAEIIASLRPPRIWLMFDKDPAGIGAIISAKQRLRKFPLYVCRYPKGKTDPAELGKGAYRTLERAVPMLKFAKVLSDKGVKIG